VRAGPAVRSPPTAREGPVGDDAREPRGVISQLSDVVSDVPTTTGTDNFRYKTLTAVGNESLDSFDV
jgi:hypothetical protein